jgi:hypothetical protein
MENLLLYRNDGVVTISCVRRLTYSVPSPKVLSRRVFAQRESDGGQQHVRIIRCHYRPRATRQATEEG